MNRRIVVAIDADISPSTQLALQVASSLLALSSPQLGIVLLHVIPVPQIPQSRFGMSGVAPIAEQRELAEHALHKARTELQKQGIVPERIEILLRSGIPAEEIVKAATERDADFILLGSRGNSFKQQMRRFLMGSTSRRVLKLAACPVMIASLPRTSQRRNLVAWYKQAILHCLHEQPDALMIFTSDEVAHMFTPPYRTVGRKEVDAASLALEQLSREGVLFCQTVQGELRYMND